MRSSTSPLTDTPAIVSKFKEISDLWCVYECYIIHPDDEIRVPELVFINVCKLTDVYKLKDARSNSEWVKIVDSETTVMVRVIKTNISYDLMRNHALTLLHDLKPMPRCNLYGAQFGNQHCALRCSNGKTYRSQTEAALELGLNQSQISKHLRGEIKSVKGFVFSYDYA